MNPAAIHNIGALLTVEAAAGGRAVAGGTGDATEVDGQYVDRLGHQSAVLVISGTATLAQAATLTIAANAQDDADGAGAGTDYGDAYAATTVATGGTGGSTEHFEVRLNFDLAAARRYIRAQITPNLSAANTDLCQWGATWILGPKQETPN